MGKSIRKEHQSFDYIVVGGGTAGLTIATRLAEDPKVTVAVIEAGSRFHPISKFIASIPGADVLFVGTKESFTTIDWGFKTLPEPASGNKERSYARGKCLGGSSTRNFMIYQRPCKGALDKWADEVGDLSWNFDNFLPFYKKSVHFTPPASQRQAETRYNAEAFDSTAGPLSVSYPNFASPFSQYMQGAMNEIGLPSVEDFNSGYLHGVQYCSTTTDPKVGKRSSSATAFLNAGLKVSSTNLKVFTSTMAKKIQFVGGNATGIIVRRKSREVFIAIGREIILSAGAFQSPQILMVSGVGPAEELDKFGIHLVADRPGVGQNMQDHIFFGPAYKVNITTLTKVANNPLFLAKEFAKYVAKKSGFLENNVADLLGWEKVPDNMRDSLGEETKKELSQLPADWPEIEYLSGGGYVGDWSGLLFKQPKDGAQYASILAAIVAPTSRGNIALKSADTKDLPIINTAYLESQTDQKVAIVAYKRVREAFASTCMQQIVEGDEYYPGLRTQTDEEILEVVKNSLQTVWHASCTCKMGMETERMAVVDSHARVIGVRGVRVVDASSFPFLPPGHPQSTVYALAEKIADMIKSGQ